MVAERLRAWGLDVAEGIAHTGVALKRKRGRPRSIGLRAGPDALHIEKVAGRSHS